MQQGNRIVLREGNNDFICQPGKPQFVAQPATCYTINSKPRITYMLAGATQRSITDPDDKTSPALAVGPHWMIMMPFDPKTTGLPVTYSYCRGGPHHVGRNPLRPPAHHGEAVERAVWRSGGVALRVPRCSHPWIYVECAGRAE